MPGGRAHHPNVDAILAPAGRRTPSHSYFPRRGAGVAEQGCLLSSYPDKIGIGGSNPPLSATSHIAHAYTDQNHRNKIAPRERPGSSVQSSATKTHRHFLRLARPAP